MSASSSKTALVTGATSGLGLEAAAQLAAGDYATVIITGRTAQRAEAAGRLIAARGASRTAVTRLTMDLADSQTIDDAVAQLAEEHRTIDFLLLNAGMIPGSKRKLTDEGIDETFAAAIIGHHRLTVALLERGLLSANARIVISGSEAARNDVPMMKVSNLRKLAESDFGGNLQATANALITGNAPKKFKSNDTYANAKVFVAWWAAALARRLPAGITVNAVSPGATPTTDAARNKGFMMRRIMMPMMSKLPKFMKMAAPISVGADRYLAASEFEADITGQFFASAPKKMSGDLHRVDLAHISDVEAQEAAWAAIVSVTGADYQAD